jgi:pimeloyl-ACP methyl ester carboxylesterase
MKIMTTRLKSAMTSPLFLVALLTIVVVVASLRSVARALQEPNDGKPTVVLVHGAFAESSSWNGVTERLLARGYLVIAVANPLRSVKTDAAYVADLLDSIRGPVILVAHSYGGDVISVAATGKANVKALVYVSGVAPDVGESAASLSGRFPGSTLESTLAPPVLLADGNKDLYIQQEKYHAQFAADVSLFESNLMAASQRPITEAALNEPATSAAWKTIPSWFLYGSLDKNIPPAAHAFMAKRAGAKETVEIEGASHVVMISHPDALVQLIDDAADSTAD